jgi:predicted Ser/Thr protein kinase
MFAYEYVPGDFILDYLDKQGVKRNDVVAVLKQVFEQMFTMDHLGLNKEEMHHPVKHIIITPKGRPVLLDFERCKKRDKTHNVTQFGQFLISGRMIPHLQRHGMRINMLEMLNRTRIYSEKRNRENFEKIVDLVK